MAPDISRDTVDRSADTAWSLSAFERFLVSVLTIAALISGTVILSRLNTGTFVNIPRGGGTFTEGIVGTPRFVNPLLAASDADKDLVSVVYAGLMTRAGGGELVPELAESYTVSPDGTVYTFTLRNGATFHDGQPVTADDVVFTMSQASNPALHSPVFPTWDGVKVSSPDPRTVIFTLPQPYTPFIENTTLGILPKHIWGDLTPDEFSFSQYNTTPVGAGPYMVDTIARDNGGIPTSYTLSAFPSYALGAPHIQTLVFRLFRNGDEVLNAFANGGINGTPNASPKDAENLLTTRDTPSDIAILRAPLLRTFAIFFNQNKQPLFLHDEVREALSLATPRQAIVGEVLLGYGTAHNSVLPIESTGTDLSSTSSSTDTQQSTLERARALLEEAGWKRGEDGVYELKKKTATERLTINLVTVNTPELSAAAERIADRWREVGATVDVRVYEPNDLTQSVIRPRRYEALLFGEVVGHDRDLYAFWHSSQRNDPGLNIAQFADIETDALLEKARTEADRNIRAQLLSDINAQIEKKLPALFLYSPDMIYLTRGAFHSVVLHPLVDPSERFDTVHTWYLETDHVWPFVRNFLSPS